METDAAVTGAAGAPPRTAGTDLLFYDGSCGLCHRWVRFAMQRDLDGSRFRFAPIGGSTWSAAFQPSVRKALPDSLVLRTSDGRTLVRSDAVLHIGERLDGPWPTLSRVAGLLPRWLLDLGYDGVARVRPWLFAPPAQSCPVVPAELRVRFFE
jgi:predicted DCC family thiol-disulfide oxidoreductase YuxK